MITSSVSKSTIEKLLDPFRLLILRSLILRRLVFKYAKIKYWGLSVFIIRKIKYREDPVNTTISLLEKSGFIVIHNKKLDKQEIKNLKIKTPKMKWVKSDPEFLIVAYDPHPVPMISPKFKVWIQLYPDLDNARLLIKHIVRRKINKLLESSYRGKHFHATDNSYEALDYINAIDDLLLKVIKKDLINKFGFCLNCDKGYKFINKCNNCKKEHHAN